MPVVILEDRALISVAGPDAEHFLQNVLTTDLDKLPKGIAVPGALLTPQGKIQFDFLISRRGEDGFLLECRTDIASDFAKRLTFYRLRAKADITLQNQPVALIWSETDSGSSQTDSTLVSDSRFRTLDVFRDYGREAAATASREEWNLLRVENGVAESGSDYELGDAFPHDVLLDQLDGVGFRKGCYIGQEVVSRMQHRGTARRRVLLAESAQPLNPQAEIFADGKPVGRLGTTVGTKGLAIARIDRVKAAMDAGVPLLAEGTELKLAIPAWARFSFPEPGAEES
ncbi:MAG: folate-binding protein YgfZ [Rhizobiaceae bacterium]|nr:folate-binding protein YgfZ [Rhizobiaceae bacterium]